LSEGSTVYTSSGNTNAGSTFSCNTTGTITFGTTAITFTLISSAVTYIVQSPLDLTGNTLSLAGTVAATNGGTGTNTVTTGDLLYGSASNTWSKLPAGAAYKSLVMNSGGTQVEWNAVPLNQSGAVSGTLPATSGGTGQSGYATGDTLYSSATNTLAKLSGNTDTTPKYMRQVGTGSASQAPTWDTLAASDITSGTLAVARGGTNIGSYTTGDLIYASGTTTLATLADAATGNVLLSGGAGVAPAYGKVGLGTHVSGQLPTANGGTNLTSFTSGGAMYATSTSALTTGTLPVTAGGTGVTTLSGIAFGNGTSAFSAASAAQIVSAIGTTAVTNATNATNATNTVNTGITEDTATATAVYPTWVTANTGNLPQKTTSTRFSFVPSTGVLSATQFSGSGAGLTSIPNSALTNSSITVTAGTGMSGGGSVSLGGSVTLTNAGVTSFSAGTTGLTPSTGTTGAVTLAGTLAVANGGTGSTTAGGARTNLGATTVGGNLFTLTNPSAVTFPRFNADNTVSALDAATFRSAIGAGTSSATGTVTSVATGSGLTGGTITTTGTISLATAYGDTVNPYASKTANTFLAAPNGSSGVPTFRAIVAADIPTLNQNTTGSAGSATNAVNVAVTTSATASAFKVPFANTTASTTGNYGLLQDSEATFTYNPSTNTLAVGSVSSTTATVTPNTTGVSTGLNVVNGDITTYRSGGTTGVIYLSNSGSRYLFWDGTNYNMPGGNVVANGTTLTGNTGTVTSVATSGSVNGLTLTGGTITTSGTITLGGSITSVSTSGNFQMNSLGIGTAGSGTAGEIRATNNITAYYSDERLKTKIGSIDNALEKVKQIETMVYHANETAVELGYDASIIEVGVTAQSVQRVMPQTVAPAPIDDKYLTVRYERLVPLLIEAIKELEAQVAELKAK
jgi:hypothetical protein